MNDERFSGSELDRWRAAGDPQADALARALLTAYGSAGPDGPGGGDEALDEVDVLGLAVRALLAGSASPDDDVRRWLLEGPGLPAWADDEQIAAGQRFFARWPLPIATTLFCAALPTAFAAPRGAAVMMATSRLGQRGYVARRLAETGHMVFDVMDPTTALRVPAAPGAQGDLGRSGDRRRSLRPGSQAYLTVRSVRLLHGLVRQALLAGSDTTWPPGSGMPINQEELLGTLLTFTVTALDGLDRLGVPVADDEAAAYLHTWCVVGAVLGIDGALLPLTLGEARDLAGTIARRQLGSSPEGAALAHELLREMRMAMPDGCRGLPAALVHHLEPDVARMLRVPPAGPIWPRVVDVACSLARAGNGVPVLRELVAVGPGAAVGRSVLRLFMDRQEQGGAPPYRVAPGELLQRVRGRGGWRRVALRTARRQRRNDRTLGAPSPVAAAEAAEAAATAGAAGALAVSLPAGVVLPIDAEDVRLIATAGFPLWEPVDTLVRRNRRITLAYADLSRELSKVIAGGGERDANWCTFATWSSMTIGTFIEDIPKRGEPRPAPTGGWRSWFSAEELTRRAMQRTDGASFRTLAAGNRVVFLEIGLAIATFIDRLGDRSDDEHEREARWASFWAAIETQLAAFATLDESWMLTTQPDPEDLRRGLREYFEALHADDLHERSQHVLAGNLLLGAYEQRRVDGYVWAALALFTKRAVRRLIAERTGRMSGFRRWLNSGFARLLTQRMELLLPGGEVLEIDEPIPPPADPGDRWKALATDDGVTLPLLQALLTRYELAASGPPPPGCRNWTSFDERMRTIGWLFRHRQRQQSLFGDPFEPTGEAPLAGVP